ncbi:MAG: cell division protein FtsB [Gammaproteobacteria bacterium]|nr:cell division protein FtsB [Gammaproteobacteria bacterium]MDH5693966.1 cell division protein FtsB [Gammaproteobacteria bacterium]
MQYTLWFGQGGFPDAWKLQKAVEVQRADNKLLEKRNTELQAEVLDLKQGLAAVEEHARYELGMIRKDEIFYQVIEE